MTGDGSVSRSRDRTVPRHIQLCIGQGKTVYLLQPCVTVPYVMLMSGTDGIFPFITDILKKGTGTRRISGKALRQYKTL